MSDHQITIETNKLAAALKCAAVKDVRHYLNAVHIFKDQANGKMLIESTNGHYLFRGTLADDGPDINWLIPADKIKLACSSKIKETTITDTSVGAVMYQPIVDTKFPNTDKVIPSGYSGEAGQYNPYYLTLCNDALRLWENNKAGAYGLKQNGTHGPAKMESDTAFCIIMPRRM